MKYLRNLMGMLCLAGSAMGSAHAERDAELRAEMTEPFSAVLIAILIANACVAATGVRIARSRTGHARPAASLAIDAHDRVPDLV